MEEAQRSIAEFIKSIRVERGYSQSYIADSLGIPLRTYQSWEKSYLSSAPNLFALAAFYSIPAERFFVGLDRAMQGLEPTPLREPSLDLARMAANGASAEELATRFPELVAADDPLEDINTAILDAYFSQGSRLVEAERKPALEEALSRSLGLSRARVVVVDTGKLSFQTLKEIALADYGARLIQGWGSGKPLFRLGISNGYAIARILDSLPRKKAENLSLFPLNFTQTPADFPVSTTSLISSFQYRHEGRCAEYRHMNEDEVYGAMMLADAAILGIGTFKRRGLYSRMISAALGGAYLEKVVSAGAVGDFNYYPIGEEGRLLDFPELVAPLGSAGSAALVKSIGLELLAKKADRDCPVAVAAAGQHKAELVRIVSRKGYVNTVLVDSSLAEALA
ncbi:MAG: helix-turn-helix domain-containing protein [Spirochaetes bacterium]|nr:helix-turn-helix domain-containing protein [Spirochaetota bacterium]MBU1079203.1 helix-turn-helix domain-containing protein [Spirochaetota bacterium]